MVSGHRRRHTKGARLSLGLAFRHPLKDATGSRCRRRLDPHITTPGVAPIGSQEPASAYALSDTGDRVGRHRLAHTRASLAGAPAPSTGRAGERLGLTVGFGIGWLADEDRLNVVCLLSHSGSEDYCDDLWDRPYQFRITGSLVGAGAGAVLGWLWPLGGVAPDQRPRICGSRHCRFPR